MPTMLRSTRPRLTDLADRGAARARCCRHRRGCPASAADRQHLAGGIFRVTEAARPSLLIDEADTFAHENDELRGVHQQFAFPRRRIRDPRRRRRRGLRAAEVLDLGADGDASIGKDASTITDRSIMIKMERKTPDQTVARMRIDRAGFNVLCRKVARWVADNDGRLRSRRPGRPAAVNDGTPTIGASCWRSPTEPAATGRRAREAAIGLAPPKRTPRRSACSCSPTSRRCSTRVEKIWSMIVERLDEMRGSHGRVRSGRKPIAPRDGEAAQDVQDRRDADPARGGGTKGYDGPRIMRGVEAVFILQKL